MIRIDDDDHRALEGASGRMGANACLPFLAASNLLRLSGLITAICASRSHPRNRDHIAAYGKSVGLRYCSPVRRHT